MKRKVKFRIASRGIFIPAGLAFTGVATLIERTFGPNLISGYSNYPVTNSSLQLISLTFFGLAIAFYFAYRVFTNNERKLLEDGIEVEGTVLTTREMWSPPIVPIEYIYNGKTFRKDKKFYFYRISSKLWKAGTIVRIFLDPENPEHSTVYEFCDFEFQEQ